MTLREEVEKIFESYGSSMTLYQQGREVQFRGFLQHFNLHTWQNMEKSFSPLGEIPRGRHVLLAPYDTEIRVGDVVDLQGIKYTLRRVEIVMCGDERLYCWGLCVERGADGQW